jgi:hypothetical protein
MRHAVDSLDYVNIALVRVNMAIREILFARAESRQ